jgi:hypothetical protein
MAQDRIFGPLFAMMILTMVVWAYMYAKRIPFIRSLNTEPNQLTPAELARRSPASVSNPSDNLKNLFEIPVIFYALTLYLFAARQVDGLYLAAAWAFVVLRILHSAVHCTINIVLLRFALYAASCACLFFILLRSVMSYVV